MHRLALTEHNRCKKMMISTAFELRLESASTGREWRQPVSRYKDHALQLTIQIVMPNVHVIDALAGEAWCHWHVFLLHVQDERQEALDICWRNIVSVGALDEGLLTDR